MYRPLNPGVTDIEAADDDVPQGVAMAKTGPGGISQAITFCGTTCGVPPTLAMLDARDAVPDRVRPHRYRVDAPEIHGETQPSLDVPPGRASRATACVALPAWPKAA